MTEFDALLAMNRAQLVVLAEARLLDADDVVAIAEALDVLAGDSEPAHRSGDYLDLEAALSERVGVCASNLHLGRSRNDLGATRERMLLRESLLVAYAHLIDVRSAVIARAHEHVTTIIPAYTHGVQAQPTTLAHVLLALDASLGRDADRLAAALERVDRSPLGAGAMTTSGFLLDRARLADLLGFDGLIENAYDCIGVASADSKAEVVLALTLAALTIGRFCKDLLEHHRAPLPGITLRKELLTGSSIMPQKENPGILEDIRATCSELVANGQSVVLLVHNTPFGDVADVRGRALNAALSTCDAFARVAVDLSAVLGALVVHPERLSAEVRADYSTMTELADELYRRARVPFRIGHEFAARLARHGRDLGIGPGDLDFDDVQRIYVEVTGGSLPLEEDDLRKTLDAHHFVASRRGRGGPQPDETLRMLAAQARHLDGSRAWLEATRTRHERAHDELHERFTRLAPVPIRHAEL